MRLNGLFGTAKQTNGTNGHTEPARPKRIHAIEKTTGGAVYVTEQWQDRERGLFWTARLGPADAETLFLLDGRFCATFDRAQVFREHFYALAEINAVADREKVSAADLPANEPDSGLRFTRRFCPEGVEVFETCEWEQRTVEIKGKPGEPPVFRQEDVLVPKFYSDQAARVVASKYLHGDPARGTIPEDGGRERDVELLLTRVCGSISRWGWESDRRAFATEADRDAFEADLTYLCLHQYGSFNSPVWFNVGLADEYGLEGNPEGWRWSDLKARAVPCEDNYVWPQSAACFLQGVEDSIEGILDLAKSEAMLFKNGSGTGTDLSTLRSTREKLSGGGRPSGPVSFLRIYDKIGGQIKSGGKTRRAARLNVLRDDHPDIRDFIRCKAAEDAKARTLIAGGYSAGMTGDPDEAYSSVDFQNTNVSVRASDAFMSAATATDDADRAWALRAVTTGEAVETVDAVDLLDEVAACTWACGDPGMQFDDTINRWNPVPNSGRFRTSNPCLRRGTRILTERGWMLVEDAAAVSQREKIKVFDGTGFVEGEVWQTGVKSLVRLHLNSGETLDLTPDHRVYTTDGWVEAARCMEKVLPRVLPNIPSTGDSTGPKAVRGGSGHYYSAPPITLMEALGFLQGDGGLRDEFVTVYYTPEKDGDFVRDTVMPALEDIAADVGETDYKASPASPPKTGYVISRRKLVDWLKAVGFQFVPLPERTLPEMVWSAKRNQQAAFLRGLFGANGNVCKDARNAIVLVSTCRRMLQEVQLLLRTMGIMSSVRVHNKASEVEWDNGVYVSRESYHLEITHQQDIAAFNRQVGFPQECQRAKAALAVDPNPADKRDAGPSKRAYMTVTHVETLNCSDEVYDFRAPTTSMGLCEGLLVHNCGEFQFLDGTACNLASLNLLKFLREDGTFDTESFRAAVRVFITAQEILVDRSSYPTEIIAGNSHRFRPLGLGYANLGALLMVKGLPYDSDEGRHLAGAVTALMHAQALLTSAELAEHLDPFEGFEENREPYLNVVRMHREAAAKLEGEVDFDLERDTLTVAKLALDVMRAAEDVGHEHGYRNAQVTLLAPTGTIMFMMDCDTGGVEPALSLVSTKNLSGGGTMTLVNGRVGDALRTLGYEPETANQIIKHVKQHGTVEDVDVGMGMTERSGLKPEHLPVFDCSFPAFEGGRCLHWKGHIQMMAAVQPFLSGAQSKTINMPASVTPTEIREAYVDAWLWGVKAVAIYRDGSKGVQPVTAGTGQGKEKAPAANWTEGPAVPVADMAAMLDHFRTAPAVARPRRNGDDSDPLDILADELEADRQGTAEPMRVRWNPVGSLPDGSAVPRVAAERERMPDTRNATTHHFVIDGHDGYINVGFYPDGRTGEVFIKMAKEGSTLAGLMDSVGVAVSIGLQYGVPLEAFVRKFAHARFEPAGFTRNPEIPIAKSIVDYVFRWLGIHFVPGYREESGPAPKLDPVLAGTVEAGVDPAEPGTDRTVTRTVVVHENLMDADVDLTVYAAAPAPNPAPRRGQSDAPPCRVCGSIMNRQGSCYSCPNCFTTSGCG